MAQQPPARSWFRLASLARMEAAEAAAAARATQTAPTPLLPRVSRPQQQPNLPPPPPPTPLQQLPTPPPPPPMPQPDPQPELPVTPAPQPEIQTQRPITPSFTEPQRPPTPPRAPTPLESPKVIKPSNYSPPPSPKTKQTTTTLIQPTPIPEPEPEIKPPLLPVPHTFSPAPEEKTITNSSGSRANHNSYNNQQGGPTKEDKKLKVITMAGENTGAVMDIGSAALRRLGHDIQQADGNGNGRKMEQEHEDDKKGGKAAAKTKHMGAVVNSNVQGINNSIVLNSSTTQHSPGVHITFASNRKPKGSASSSSNKEHHSDHLH